MVQHADGGMIQKAAEEMLFFRPSEDINDRDGAKPISEQSLQELLAASGYSVDEPSQAETVSTPATQHEIDEQELINSRYAVGLAKEGPDSDDDYNVVYCDPTLPQFRPDSADEPPRRCPITGEFNGSNYREYKKEENEADATAYPSTSSDKRNVADHPDPSQEPQDPNNIPINTLVQWRFLDLAEKEAKERGGWGRLNYEEFETAWKLEEEQGNRLDYLGTWIDFCIPYH